LLAFASLTGRDVSMTLAQEVLRDVLRHEERGATIEGIQKFVAEFYHLRVSELKAKGNSKSIALPRQVAMYLCKTLTTASLPEIGKNFSGKHHSTVIHSIRKVEALRNKDAAFNSLINTLIQSFR
jgi:chromosomal replication initiator protein